MHLIKRRVKKMSGAYREDYFTGDDSIALGFLEPLNQDCYRFFKKFSTRNEALFVIATLDKGPEYLVEEYHAS